MKSEFARRMKAATRGDTLHPPKPIDKVLRALVTQLQDGTPAAASGAYRIVADKRPSRDWKR